MLVVCHIMASINMMWAETAEQHDMLSNGRLCKVYQLFAGRVILGLRLSSPPPPNPTTQRRLLSISFLKPRPVFDLGTFIVVVKYKIP